jgi:trk system potassium uptake protein TrkA
MDTGALERAGIGSADAFMAITQGDNRNYFASQLAREIYHVPRVLCRIYDPVREEIFRELGLETFSPTSLGSKVMVQMLLGTEQGEG